MNSIIRTRPLAALLLALAFPLATTSGAHANDVLKAPTVEITAEASQSAANDLVVAVLYVEHSGTDASAVAREVNRRISAALETARTHADVSAQSAGSATWPVYGKDRQERIEAWRMRSEIRLESRNVAAISALVGNLQADLALSQLSMQPAPETRRAAVDEATVAAIRAFEKRAGIVANALGKRYRIAHLSINDSGMPPPYVRMRAAPAMMMADSAPAPMEGGDSQISVNVQGRIELTD